LANHNQVHIERDPVNDPSPSVTGSATWTNDGTINIGIVRFRAFTDTVTFNNNGAFKGRLDIDVFSPANTGRVQVNSTSSDTLPILDMSANVPRPPAQATAETEAANVQFRQLSGNGHIEEIYGQTSGDGTTGVVVDPEATLRVDRWGQNTTARSSITVEGTLRIKQLSVGNNLLVDAFTLENGESTQINNTVFQTEGEGRIVNQAIPTPASLPMALLLSGVLLGRRRTCR
jgi:uncharacterized protein (TIGR03382 family)